MRVAVVGATGHTGRLVVAALRARAAVEVVACGRSGGDRRIDVRHAASVRDALRDVDAVAHLAGPFLPNGFAVADEAVRRGIPYADTTGEQSYMKRLFDRHAGASSPLVPALAYEYALADLAARAHLPDGGEALHVLYRHRGASASAGTKKSVVRVAAGPALGYERGRLVRTSAARYHRTFATTDGPRTGVSFPGGEQLTVPRHTHFRTIRTYAPTKPSRVRAARLLAPVARVLLREPVVRAIERRIDERHRAPDNAKSRSEIHLVAEGPDRAVLLSMGDAYVVTAELLAEGLLRAKGAGVVAPSEAMNAGEVLSALHRRLPDFRVDVIQSEAETKK